MTDCVECDKIPFNTDATIIGWLNLLIFFLGSVGNTLVIVAVLLSKKLQTIPNAFIVNLAVADLVTSLVMSFFVTAQWRTCYSPSLELLCRFAMTVVYTTVYSSIYNLAMIAMNRFIFITSPLQIYRKIYKRNLMFLWISLPWIISISVVIFPPLFLDIGKFGFDPSSYTCHTLPGYHSSSLYNTIIAIGGYPLPLLIITVSYTGIFTIIKHRRRFYSSVNLQVTSTSENNGNDGEIPDGESSNRPRVTPLEIQVIKNMFIIFCAFMVSLTPIVVCTFSECVIDRYVRTIVAFNSVMNPFIYGFNHPIFRQVFTSFFKCQPIPEPSSFLINFKRRFDDFASSLS